MKEELSQSWNKHNFNSRLIYLSYNSLILLFKEVYMLMTGHLSYWLCQLVYCALRFQTSKHNYQSENSPELWNSVSNSIGYMVKMSTLKALFILVSFKKTITLDTFCFVIGLVLLLSKESCNLVFPVFGLVCSFPLFSWKIFMQHCFTHMSLLYLKCWTAFIHLTPSSQTPSSQSTFKLNWDKFYFLICLICLK